MTGIRRSFQPATRRGYVLLEIIIALTVFAVVVTGLAGVLHSTLDGANDLRKQAAIRRGLEAVIIEAKQKSKREEMEIQYRDEALGVDFRTSLEELKWVNDKGRPVRGMFALQAVARPLDGGDTELDRAEVYVYRP